jgi:hypothetical protein
MGLRNKDDVQLIRHAMALDCKALGGVIMYRGARFNKESVVCQSAASGEPDSCNSLSFGTSLFAGVLYDGGAVAYHYMRKCESAYAIFVPFDKIRTSILDIPIQHSIIPLYAYGETVHARSKYHADASVSKSLQYLRTNLTLSEIDKQFIQHLRHAILIKVEHKVR